MRLLQNLIIALMLCISATSPHFAFSQTPLPIHGETIRFAAGETRSGELFRPTTGKPGSWPGIVIVHDAAGVTDPIRDEASNLAAHGYLVLVVNLYEGEPASSTEDAQAKWHHLNHKTVMATCEGAMGYLQGWMADPELVGAVGWGAGGSLVLELAADQSHLKAAVDRGGPSPLNDATFKQASGRTLILPEKQSDDALMLRFLDTHLKPKR